MPDAGRQTGDNAAVDNSSSGKDRRFTRLEAARMSGLSSVNAIAHRELRAGIVPDRDERGVIVYTHAQLDAMSRAVGPYASGKQIAGTEGRDDTEIEVARAVFQAFADGKDSVEVVLMGLATPKQAASLAAQWAKMPPKMSRGGLGLSQDAVLKLAAMLGADVRIKSEEDLVGAVAGFVSTSRQNASSRAAPPRTSNAIPRAWSSRPVPAPGSVVAASEPEELPAGAGRGAGAA